MPRGEQLGLTILLVVFPNGFCRVHRQFPFRSILHDLPDNMHVNLAPVFSHHHSWHNTCYSMYKSTYRSLFHNMNYKQNLNFLYTPDLLSTLEYMYPLWVGLFGRVPFLLKSPLLSSTTSSFPPWPRNPFCPPPSAPAPLAIVPIRLSYETALSCTGEPSPGSELCDRPIKCQCFSAGKWLDHKLYIYWWRL